MEPDSKAEAPQGPRYVIREVDGHDPDTAFTLMSLNKEIFAGTAHQVGPWDGHWWLVYDSQDDDKPIGFAGLTQDVQSSTGYLNRSGVLPVHRGHRLQVRLLRAREGRARRNGWNRLVSDTTDNVPSANNMIRAGYLLFEPINPWAFKHSLYWEKTLS